MKTILQTIVPAYPWTREEQAHKPVTLGAWFNSNKYADQVAQIRALPDSEERAALIDALPSIRPYWTYGGPMFTHSGFLCMEILRMDNPGLILSAAKEHLSKIENVALIAINATAEGLLVFVPIRHPLNHYPQFHSACEAFAAMGYQVDRLSGMVDAFQPYTFDPAIYVNEQATPFAGTTENRVNEEDRKYWERVRRANLVDCNRAAQLAH